jgi:hypothetical protein
LRSVRRDGSREAIGIPNGMRMLSALVSMNRFRAARGASGFCCGGSFGNDLIGVRCSSPPHSLATVTCGPHPAQYVTHGHAVAVAGAQRHDGVGSLAADPNRKLPECPRKNVRRVSAMGTTNNERTDRRLGEGRGEPRRGRLRDCACWAQLGWLLGLCVPTAHCEYDTTV